MNTSSTRSIRPGAGLRLAGLATLASLLLAGCFGGDSDSPVPPEPPAATDGDVPLGALASATAYAQFVGAQASDDRRPPLALGALPAPVSETDAPIPVL